MRYLRQLLGKGRFHIFIIYALVIQAQRKYLLPHSKLGKQVTLTAKEELTLTDPQNDYSNIDIFKLSTQQQQFLKTITKKKIAQIQALNDSTQETWPFTAGILTLGGINYFFHPTICAFCVGGYLTLLTLDYVKSISVLKYNVQPMWEFKMSNVGFMVSCVLGVAVVQGVTRAGLKKLKEKVTKAIVLKNNPEKKQ